MGMRGLGVDGLGVLEARREISVGARLMLAPWDDGCGWWIWPECFAEPRLWPPA